MTIPKLRALALSLAVVLAACAPSETATLTVENGTDLDVTLFVNGVELAEISAQGGGAIHARELPSLPWSVEARSPSGRVLASMPVRPGDLAHTIEPGGAVSSTGTIELVDLSCGRLILWAGYTPPSVPAPIANAGKPGDCAP